MILNQTIVLKPNPITDPKTNTIINPPSIVLENPNFVFQEIASAKIILAKTNNLPFYIVLYKGKDYEDLNNNWSKQQLENKLLEILGDNPQAYLQSLFPKTLEMHPYGPGTILSSLLSSIGIKSTPNCTCRQRAIIMNENGPDWCEQNIDTIIGWLKEEATKRKLPFIETVARLFVNRAIKISRQKLADNNEQQQ
jgi:hypothetical protein